MATPTSTGIPGQVEFRRRLTLDSSRASDSATYVDLRLVPFVLVLWLVEWLLLARADIRDPSSLVRHCVAVLGLAGFCGAVLATSRIWLPPKGTIRSRLFPQRASAHYAPGRKALGPEQPMCPDSLGRSPPRRGAIVVPLAAGCGIFAVASGLSPLLGAPWSGLYDGAQVELRAVTVSSPVVVPPRADRGPALVGVTVQTKELVHAGKRAFVRQRVRVWAAQETVGRVTVGTQVVVRGRWSPRQPGRPEAGSVRAGPRSGWIVGDAPRGTAAFSAHVRDGLARAVHGAPPDAAALVRGLALGDTAETSVELGQAMRRAGLSHLTAVSGSNVAIVVGAVGVLVVLLGAGKAVAVGSGAAALAAYTVVVGPEPSVVRATAMGAVLLLGLASGIRAGPSRLLVAVAVLLLTDPWLSVSAGFAMSAGATAALIALGLVVHARSRGHRRDRRGTRRRVAAGRLGRIIGAAAAVAGVAFLATTPVVVGLGQPIPVYSVLANLVAAPAVPIVTVFGLLAAVLSLAAPALAVAVAKAASVPAGWIAFTAHRVSSWPGAALAWPSGWLGVVTVILAELGILLAVWCCHRWWHRVAPGTPGPRATRSDRPAARAAGRRMWRSPALVVSLATLTILGLVGGRLVLARQSTPSGWITAFCDVGQGDAAVVRTGLESAVLVDAGPDPTRVDGCLRRLRVRRLDAVLLTHFHADHVGGLPGALRGRTIGAILASPLADPAAGAAAARAQARAAGRELQIATAGMVFRVGQTRWSVLWPARLLDGDGSAPNNASVATVVSLDGGLCLLLAADIEPAAQSMLLANATRGEPAPTSPRGSASRGSTAGGTTEPLAGLWPPGCTVRVVKVPHHGSRHQDPQLAARARAQWAVVSVGENDYGHPAPQTLRAWEDAGTQVRRTDQGMVVIATAPAGAGGFRIVGGA